MLVDLQTIDKVLSVQASHPIIRVDLQLSVTVVHLRAQQWYIMTPSLVWVKAVCVCVCVCVVLKPRAAGESRLPWTQLCLHEDWPLYGSTSWTKRSTQLRRGEVGVSNRKGKHTSWFLSHSTDQTQQVRRNKLVVGLHEEWLYDNNNNKFNLFSAFLILKALWWWCYLAG